MKRKKILSVIIIYMFIIGFATIGFSKEIFVYSARKEHLIKPLFEAYEKKTGVSIKYITDKAAPLMQRLKSEGRNTKADLFLTVDAGNLWAAAKEGLLQPVNSSTLNNNIPIHLRDSENRWFGFSVRARTIAFSTERVKPSELSTYENLGDKKWKGRLCLRTSKKVYNQSLVAMFIADYGENKTEEIVKSWVNNLATIPFSSDTKVLEAIAAGQCDLGIVNTYYFGRLQKKNNKIPIALFWPNQNEENKGVHVNISGGGVTTHAKHRDEAVKLLEWLSSDEAQNLFADSNMEYPANPKVKPHADVEAWGSFKQNTIKVVKAGELQKKAIMLMDRVNYK